MIKTEEEAIKAISEWEKDLYSAQEIQKIQEEIANQEEIMSILNERVAMCKELIEHYQRLLKLDAENRANIEKARKLIKD